MCWGFVTIDHAFIELTSRNLNCMTFPTASSVGSPPHMCEPGRKPLSPCHAPCSMVRQKERGGYERMKTGHSRDVLCVSTGNSSPKAAEIYPWRILEAAPCLAHSGQIGHTIASDPDRHTSTSTMAPPRLTAMTGPSNTTSSVCISSTFAHAFSYWIRRMETWTCTNNPGGITGRDKVS